MASTPISQSVPAVKHPFDFHLLDGGSIFVLTPLTPLAPLGLNRMSGVRADSIPIINCRAWLLSNIVDGIFDDRLDNTTEVRR